MKKILLSFLIIVLSFPIQAQQNAKKYTVKSGKIVLQLNGSTKGTRTIYFDDYGDKHYEHEKSVTEVTMLGITDRTEKDIINITNKNYFWTIDNISHRNMKGELPFYNMGKQAYANMTEAEQKKFNDDIIASFGGEKLGTEKVIGRSCEKLKIMGSFVWIYKGISLKMETNYIGITANEIATKFEENTNIPNSQFQPPSGLSFTDVDQQLDMYNGSESYTEEDYEEDLIPVSYPFADFQKAMNTFNPEGFVRAMVMSEEGQHIALFTQNFTKILSVMAMAMENMDQIPEEEFGQFESFNHHGKTLRYGSINDDETEGKALLIPYKEHDMYIMLMSSPGLDKNSMLKLADQLKF